MGKYDYMTSSNVAKKYFDMIEANKKGFIAFEESANSLTSSIPPNAWKDGMTTIQLNRPF